MNIVLLSGGSGKRLWPLSNDIRSKQFIKIFKKEDGSYESMVQRVYRQIVNVDKNANITIATSKFQVSSLHNQLGNKIGISVEPCRRDTFPAIVLATAYLHDVVGVSENEAVVVCPVDPYVNDDFFKAVESLSKIVEEGKANLTLMGIEPTYPSEKYGYIIPESKNNISEVRTFKEKPTEDIAREYIEQGALWNAGVFAYRMDYLMSKAHELIDFIDYNDLLNKYDSLTKISFDYAVVEQEQSIQVLRYIGEWKDLGTWNTLTEAMSENVIGNGIMDETCNNLHILNELDLPIIAMGLKDVVISASADGILVSDKERSAHIKPIVEKLDNEVRFAEKSWGNYEVIDVEDDSMTIRINMNAGEHMSYHSHECRDEVWTVVSGKGFIIINDEKKDILPGDVCKMPAGTKHSVYAVSDLTMIEVQIGKSINVNDKIKYDFVER